MTDEMILVGTDATDWLDSNSQDYSLHAGVSRSPVA